jgi:acetyltransferase-like isoleucine patch superfamily enzyme
VTVGAHVWLGSGCTIGHDATIEDCAMIAPRALLSGFVRVGVAAYVGGGACVRQRVTIGTRALVGLGGVVISDVAPASTVVGNPARVLVRVSRKISDTPPPRGGLVDPSISTPPASPPGSGE